MSMGTENIDNFSMNCNLRSFKKYIFEKFHNEKDN